MDTLIFPNFLNYSTDLSTIQASTPIARYSKTTFAGGPLGHELKCTRLVLDTMMIFTYQRRMLAILPSSVLGGYNLGT